MNWMEFNLDVECPHCGHEDNQSFEINTGSIGREGGYSDLIKTKCWECDKDFWFKARMEIEFNLHDTRRTNPKTPKGSK